MISVEALPRKGLVWELGDIVRVGGNLPKEPLHISLSHSSGRQQSHVGRPLYEAFDEALRRKAAGLNPGSGIIRARHRDLHEFKVADRRWARWPSRLDRGPGVVAE